MNLDAFFAGIGFRTATPSFDAGDEFVIVVTGSDDDTPIARIGDSRLRIPDAPRDSVHTKVRVRVESFDDADHTGTATYLETVGDTAY
ncbi:hypothetical protein [Salarchaeum sp. JOR-1]|uniref:DUF7513 family protein n=1 Tax=Salarchaeum sp. JOR-1 TaxID=2599399 RepID=UPI0011989EBE|nr:hypothetical protein [Salarchaeum sp. JOR-1]QDX41333.1 hypothetical protein FQU85_10650 [Salarchaeum sp. JOR-1]